MVGMSQPHNATEIEGSNATHRMLPASTESAEQCRSAPASMLCQEVLRLTAQVEKLQSELNTCNGGSPSKQPADYARPSRLERHPRRLTTDPRAPRAAEINGSYADVSSGFVFILLGACSLPEYACQHVLELREAIASVRTWYPRGSERQIAILSDGAIPEPWLNLNLQPDRIEQLEGDRLGDRPHAPRRGSAWQKALLDKDVRARKLLAYGQSPFDRTVFLDADTLVMSGEVGLLFHVLDRFDLAAAFECCRIYWSQSNVPCSCSGPQTQDC